MYPEDKIYSSSFIVLAFIIFSLLGVWGTIFVLVATNNICRVTDISAYYFFRIPLPCLCPIYESWHVMCLSVSVFVSRSVWVCASWFITLEVWNKLLSLRIRSEYLALVALLLVSVISFLLLEFSIMFIPSSLTICARNWCTLPFKKIKWLVYLALLLDSLKSVPVRIGYCLCPIKSVIIRSLCPSNLTFFFVIGRWGYGHMHTNFSFILLLVNHGLVGAWICFSLIALITWLPFQLQEDQKMAARLATNMFNSLKGRPVQVSQKYFRFLLSLAYNVKTAWFFFLCVCVGLHISGERATTIYCHLSAYGGS